MTTQTITLELPESLYRSARQIAEATKRPIEEIVQVARRGYKVPIQK